jgi:hypothetical protein
MDATMSKFVCIVGLNNSVWITSPAIHLVKIKNLALVC